MDGIHRRISEISRRGVKVVYVPTGPLVPGEIRDFYEVRILCDKDGNPYPNFGIVRDRVKDIIEIVKGGSDE